MRYIYYIIGLAFASIAFLLAIPAALLAEVSGIFYNLYENKENKKEDND